MLPTVDFFGTPVTRLILGDNPMIGNSYIPEIYSGEEMWRYYNAETIVKTLDRAWELGYNTIMSIADDFILGALRQYREKGGQMNIMFQSYPPADFAQRLKDMVELKPLGIYHQGTTFDEFCESGNFQIIKDRINMIKDYGIPAGIGTHVPESALRCEEENWGVDFYMVCLHNTRNRGQAKPSHFNTGAKWKEIVFYPEDRALMYEAIRKIPKPCIAFKIFSGGQMFRGKTPEEATQTAYLALEEAYQNIKPTDICCTGVFQKYHDQLEENAGHVHRILG